MADGKKSSKSKKDRNASEKNYSSSDDDKNTAIPFTDSDEPVNILHTPIVKPQISKSKQIIAYITYILYFCFWATCWAIAIKLKFGIVYLLLSGIFGVYFNTRTGPKPKREISAYSVFNKDCKSIDGTLTAEQFEQEIRYGPVSVK